MNANLQDIVSNWGGFEEFVKEIHESDDVEVKRDVTLTGSSGAPRQIDVYVTHSKGPYKYSTLIECKYWNKKVKRQQIENMYASMDDLNASKGVIFTTLGYQSGAETYARAKNIDIYIIRDLSQDEWGKPGKVIEFYIQMFSKTILSIDLQNTMASKIIGSNEEFKQNIPLNIGSKNIKTYKTKFKNPHTGQMDEFVAIENQILSTHKKKGVTLEKYLEKASSHGLESVVNNNSFLINKGEDCTRYLQINVDMPFKEKGEILMVLNQGQIVHIPKIIMTVGIKVVQFKFTLDRSSNLLYALAVEDCIGNNSFIISKHKEEDRSNWSPLSIDISPDNDDVLQNGSIFRVTTSGFFDPNEMKGLKEKIL